MSESNPALSEREWNDAANLSTAGAYRALANMLLHAANDLDRGGDAVDPARRHALAALCLHEQPFGFTWEDVDTLRSCLRRTEPRPRDHKLLDLINRIAALLPPQSTP